MSKAKHTPGPWVISTDKWCNPHIAEIDAPESHHIALATSVYFFGDDMYHLDLEETERCQANTRLICAAPDLLGALEKLTAIAEKSIYPKPDVGPDHPYSILLDARAAIAKAKGEAS